MELQVMNYPWADGEASWSVWHVDMELATKRKCPLVMGGYKTREEAVKTWNERANLGTGVCDMECDCFVSKGTADSLATYYCSECGSPTYNDCAPSYCGHCGKAVERCVNI